MHVIHFLVRVKTTPMLISPNAKNTKAILSLVDIDQSPTRTNRGTSLCPIGTISVNSFTERTLTRPSP